MRGEALLGGGAGPFRRPVLTRLSAPPQDLFLMEMVNPENIPLSARLLHFQVVPQIHSSFLGCPQFGFLRIFQQKSIWKKEMKMNLIFKRISQYMTEVDTGPKPAFLKSSTSLNIPEI